MEIPSGPSSAELLETFAQTLEDVFEKVDETAAADARGGRDAYAEDGEWLAREEVADLAMKAEVLVDQGLMRSVPPGAVVRLLDVLEKHVARADDADVREDDDERSAVVSTTMRALDCASLALRVLGADGMPKEVYREESIEKLVDFVRHHANRNVFAFYDASYYQIHRGENARADAEDERDAEEPASPRSSRKSPSKRGKKAAAATSSSRRRSGAGGGSASRKTFADPPRVARKMQDVLAGILTKLARLLYTIHLPDATVLQLTSLSVSALEVDGVDLMQARAVDVVVAAFKQYPEHRSLILDNLLVALLKLPTTGRHLRRYMLPEDDAKSVQAISAMLMRCVQMSVTFEEEPSEIARREGAVAGKADGAGSASGYGPAFQWSHYFWKELLKGWHSARAQEIDIKALMQNLVSDLLVALNMPEWPVASLMLLSLCAQLLSSHGINSPEIRVRELALDFLGQVAARIKEDTAACEREKTWTDLFAGEDGEDGEDCDAPETLSAFELAQQDAADARSSADAADMQVTASSRADALVLEAMLLRHVRQVEARSQAPGPSNEGSAFTFALAQLSREAERRGVGFRSGGTGPGGDRETYRSLAGVLRRSEDADAALSSTGVSGGAFLPRKLAIRLFRELQQQLPLARQLHILVERLLGALEDPAITVRAAAVRALAAVVDADPRVLEWEQVRAAVRRRMSDNGTMVRSAVIDLLGKHVVRDARVAETYYAAIVERISDVGVSVRKRVIHILHDCIRTSSVDFKHGVEALRFLAFRILDDDAGIQELVVRIFRELWFSPPAAPAGPARRASAEAADPVAERAEQLVAVLWEVYCGVSRVGYAKLPLLSTFPIVAILRRVVFPSDEDAAADEARGDSTETVSTARRLCGAILNGMLSQEEAEALEEADEKDETNETNVSSFPRAVRYALGLHVFCATDPRLCVAEGNPLAFAAALHPYVKRAENTSANSLQLQCCISVVDAVVKESGCLSAATAAEMEKDLRFLLLRNTFHGVLYYASRCVCSVAEIAAAGDRKVASGALQICRRFVKLLDEVSERDELSASERAHVSRALFVLGHLARFGADTLEASREEAVSPSNLLRLFRCFLQRAGAAEFDLKRGALQACGFLFVARPHLMLCPKGGFGKGSMDGIMRAALGSSAERNLKEQALLNLDEYLREEETRALIQASDDADAREGAAVAAVAGAGGALSRAKRRRQADAKRAEASDKKAAGKKGESFQTINGEHDNSLANGVAQRYWSFVVELCTDPEPSVRLKALHLAEVVLRQGLVHPMSCFPPLIALQADPVLTVRKLAMRLLRQQHGKYPDFFDHQLGAGLGLLFEFCKRLQAAARRAARAGGRGGSATGNAGNTGLVASAAVVNQGFTNIYKLVNGARSTRFKFLRALLRRYEGKSSGSDATYLCFLANAIGALPFTMSDEALFVIFHLNRIISLRASTLQDSLAAHIAQAEDAGDADPPADLREDVEASLSASIMLSLKRHLKLTYDLADARTQAYNPAEPLKSAEAFRYDEDASEMDLSWCDPAAGATVAGCRAQADLFARLMQSDADDYGEYAPASRKRGRPKKARAVDDDDDSDDSDDDDEPFSPAIPKTASIASPRGGKGTPRAKKRRGGSSTPTPRKRLAL